MAFFPCSNHHAPYRGPSRSVYPAIVAGGETERGKLRLCEGCFDEYIGLVVSCMVEVVDEESAQSRPGCWSCKREAANGDGAAIFVTAYPPKQEPRNFYGRTCKDHWPESISTFLLK